MYPETANARLYVLERALSVWIFFDIATRSETASIFRSCFTCQAIVSLISTCRCLSITDCTLCTVDVSQSPIDKLGHAITNATSWQVNYSSRHSRYTIVFDSNSSDRSRPIYTISQSALRADLAKSVCPVLFAVSSSCAQCALFRRRIA